MTNGQCLVDRMAPIEADQLNDIKVFIELLQLLLESGFLEDSPTASSDMISSRFRAASSDTAQCAH